LQHLQKEASRIAAEAAKKAPKAPPPAPSALPDVPPPPPPPPPSTEGVVEPGSAETAESKDGGLPKTGDVVGKTLIEATAAGKIEPATPVSIAEYTKQCRGKGGGGSRF
jgi:hypothetical protein